MSTPEVSIGPDALTWVVRAAPGFSGVEVVAWSVQPILGGLDRASMVHRDC